MSEKPGRKNKLRLQTKETPPKGGLTQETIPPKIGVFGPLLCQNGWPSARMPAPLFLASGRNLPFSVLRSFVSFVLNRKRPDIVDDARSFIALLNRMFSYLSPPETRLFCQRTTKRSENRGQERPKVHVSLGALSFPDKRYSVKQAESPLVQCSLSPREVPTECADSSGPTHTQ